MFAFFKKRLTNTTHKNERSMHVKKEAKDFKKMPKTLNELDNSYRMLIRELGKR